MERECIKEAASVAEAVDAALDELGVQQDAVEYEVLEEPGRKIFGIGSERGARVRVWVKPEYLAEIEEAKSVAQEILEVGHDEAERAEMPPVLLAEAFRVSHVRPSMASACAVRLRPT